MTRQVLRLPTPQRFGLAHPYPTHANSRRSGETVSCAAVTACTSATADAAWEPIALMACIFLMKAISGGREESVVDEQDAIRRCQTGDPEAFRPIVERYEDMLMGAIYLMTRDRAVSEELVQETFVRAWKGIGTFRLGQPLKPWLVRIAVNQTLNEKARRRAPVEPLSDRDGGSTDPGFRRADERDEIRRALSRLSDEHRRVVVLRYFVDLSTREAANALGIREGTVKSRLRRALDQLREALTD